MTVEPKIRSTVLSDLEQVRAISGYYVRNTVTNFSYNEPLLEQVVSVFESVKQRNLPYLTAVESQPNDGNVRDGSSVEEKVIGYIYAGPYRPRLAYAHTLELSIFVHHSYVDQGIGSVLMRSLLDELRSTKHFAIEPGFEIKGVQREVSPKKLIAKMSYDSNGPERETGDKLRSWYRRWGFEEIGRMEGVAYKFDRTMDTIDLILDLEHYYASLGTEVGATESK